MVAPRSAATVMILRDRSGSGGSGAAGGGGEDRAVDVYMLRRASTMEFAPRMMVFPGGGVDPRDADPGLPWAGPSPAQWAQTLSADEATARELVAAAVRELRRLVG